MAYTLPELPYAYDALEPHIDEATVRLHHDKHHAGYVKGANGALEKLAKAREAGDFGAVKAIERDLAFHVSGVLNHNLYWECMSPEGGGEPEGALLDQIVKDFGSFAAFKAQFSAVTKGVEGSGWGILGWEPTAGKLMIYLSEVHQHNTLRGATPILINDVWEHAYYLKYQNRRAEYVDGWWNVVNWKKVAENFEAAK